MYRQYFGLTDLPFSIAPDPRFLYLSQRHQEALAHLIYGLNGDGGFVLLTGEIGSGKTTLCRRLLEQVPENCDLAYIFNPRLSAEELLATFCSEIGIEVPASGASIKSLVDAINAHLLQAHARGRNTVLIIDEAQNLSADVLEQVRLLTNLETDRRKLLQIVLIGQPELIALLERPELRQLSQRIVARYHLDALSPDEMMAYVRYRLEIAGAQGDLIPAALAGALYRYSAGVPRIINLLCDRALLGAYTQGLSQVDQATLTQAAREVLPPGHLPARTGRSFGGMVFLGAALLLLWWGWSSRFSGKTPGGNAAEERLVSGEGAGTAAPTLRLTRELSLPAPANPRKDE